MQNESIRDQLIRFNEERRLLLGQPIKPGERMPLAYTNVGGDVGPEDDQWEERA